MKYILLALLLTLPAFGTLSGPVTGGGAVDSVNGATGVVVLDTDDVAEGSNLYFTTARVIATAITGFSAGAGTVADTDTILQAINKIVGNISAKAPSASPTFTTSVNLNYATASQPLVTDGSKNAVSMSYATFLTNLAALPLAGGTVTGQILSTYGTGGTAFKCTSNDTKPCVGNSVDSNQGLFFYNAANMRLVYSTASYLEVGGSGVTVLGKISQYDKNTLAAMPVTGLNKFATVTSVGNTAATPTDVFSKTLAAGDWVTAKTGYTYDVYGLFANTASTDKSVKLTLGSTVLFDSGSLTSITSAGSWHLKANCDYRDSTHAVCGVDFSTNFAAYMMQTTVVVANETLANALVIKTTINGTNANDVTLEKGKILYNNESWN